MRPDGQVLDVDGTRVERGRRQLRYFVHCRYGYPVRMYVAA